jgi:quercetin 2,3-dioxygenase
MPHSDGSESNRHRGLQLWVNLAKQYKMMEPRYQELRDDEIPRKSSDGVHVKIIAGESMGIASSVFTLTPTTYLDFRLEKNARFIQPIHPDWNAFVFVLQGSGLFGTNKLVKVKPHYTIIFSKGNSIEFKNENDELLHFVLIAGKPIGEPIVQHGPFVMNTKEEIQQTFRDYQMGINGFENAPYWLSDELKRRNH